jgi:hypothetical protein
MKRAMASVALLVFAGCLADCGKSAADRLAEQRMAAIDQTCEQEADSLNEQTEDDLWKKLADVNHESISDAQKRSHRIAKNECIKRKLAGTQ